MSVDYTHLKGEIMDLEFNGDTDHRKRRRNRTTQSCLNCHTSKRKCDRKRPCQRCIQLGLTGLCVYEIDDPALRDDPSVDENTRLRNRIAELESLVRELRGKPHPRWADASFRDGSDPSERWHSRAAKNTTNTSALKRRGRSPLPEPAIKTEPSSTDIGVSHHLYRFSPSPPMQCYSGFQSDNSASPVSPYERQQSQHQFNGGGGRSAVAYGGSYPCSNSASFSDIRDTGNGNVGFGLPGHADERVLYAHAHASHFTPSHPCPCPCRTHPALITLTHQLASTLGSLRGYAQHHHSHNPATPTGCELYRRIVELDELVRTTDLDEIRSPLNYNTLPTPTESEIVSLSGHGSGSSATSLASSPFHGPPSGGTPFHGSVGIASSGGLASAGLGSAGSGPLGSAGSNANNLNGNHNTNSSHGNTPPEWGAVGAGGGYNPYFPITSGVPGVGEMYGG